MPKVSGAVVPDYYMVEWDDDSLVYWESFEHEDEEMNRLMAENTHALMEKFVGYFEEKGVDVEDFTTSTEARGDGVVAEVNIDFGDGEGTDLLGPVMVATEMMYVLSASNPKLWGMVVDVTSESAVDILELLEAENGSGEDGR